MKPSMKRHISLLSSFCCGQTLIFVLLIIAPRILHAVAEPQQSGSNTLVVVSDDDYPPYIFRDANGKVRGIIPDQWSLWEQKTGVRIELKAMDWTEAKRCMREGRADAIDTIFFSDERAKLFAFTRPYAKIEVPIYVHKALGGISDIASLKGFTIGVKADDSVADYLARQGIDSLKTYPSYEAVILAAKKLEIKVFSVDQPAAIYYLYKHGVSNEFRQSFVLYTGEFHRAVPKQRPELLRFIQNGFDRISRREYRAIDRKWLGTPLLSTGFLRQWTRWFIAGIAAILSLIMGNVLLGRRVRAKTAELRAALEEIRQSLAARQTSEEALRASREYLATVLDSINDAVFVHDVVTGSIVDVNRRMCEMYGCPSREHALSTGMESLCSGIPPYSMEEGLKWMRKALAEGPQLFEWQAKHCAGHLFWVEVNIRKVKIGADDRLLVTVRDITERKQAEEALQENHELFRLFLRHSPVYAFIKEVTPSESRTLMASDNYQQMLGMPVSEMLGKTMEKLFPPDFAAKITADDWAVVSKGEMLKVDEDMNGRHYTTIKFPIVRKGKTLLAGYTIDITDRKNADAERERLIRAIEQSSETIVITDAAGMILYVNPEFTKSTGYAREEALGQNARILQSGMHEKVFYRQLWERLRSGKTWGGKIVNKRKDGSLFIEQANIAPVRDEAGSIVNFVAVKRDITQQLRTEEEKTALQEQLMHAQKIESIGRLAGGVAHDFNNMLQAILGYTEMALEQVPQGQPLRDDLAEIKKAAQRSSDLTRQLQTFARKQPVSPVPLDINAAVENMSGMLSRLIGENIRLEWKPDPCLGSVMMDPGQMDQIVANLCVNARDAVGASGRITVATANVEVSSDEARQLDGISPGAYVKLSISDDGPGMPPDVRARIFEPFFTTKPIGQGTGLGLSIVYGSVKQNSGAIRVDSAPGKGTAFQIYLPRHTAGGQAAPEAGPADDGTPMSAAHETILLVDDEENILRPTRRILESLGYRVFATGSPKKALRLFEEHLGQIDLLITDVIMPGMNGHEMVLQMLKRQPALKYLFISGHTANILEDQGLTGLDRICLQKPFSRKILAQKARDLLTKR